ncbi:hypothetical protein BC628DRAFT_486537 [Trametes gibbosa]|nr:hypothetical protein BC628DRAFT_486537 [Trametes gibbosa]
MQSPLAVYCSSYILSLPSLGPGLGQRTLFSGVSHTSTDAAACTPARSAIASWIKTQQRRVAPSGMMHSAVLGTSDSSSAASMGSMASSSSTEDEFDFGYASSTSSEASTFSTSVPMPLPFPPARVSNIVEFRRNGSRGVSLAEWIRLTEKKRTRQCLDDPDECLDELVDDWKILYQCQWPGYDAHTCYIAVPEAVAAGTAPLRKVDFLDMVCKALAGWVLSTTRQRHIECVEPHWAIGLDAISFKHIRVVSVLEVAGYVRKWVPVLEIDARAIQP